MNSKRRLTISGLKWSTLAQASRLFTQLLSVFILANLLLPSDYGLIAMAGVLTGLVSMFRDLGSAAAIIQKPDVSPRFLDSVFWMNIASGLGFAVSLGLLAPLVAYGFAEPRLKSVLWALVVSFPVASLSTVHLALLEKASRFGPIAAVEACSAIMSLMGAVWAASLGWGVYSLVLQIFLTTLLSTIAFWILSNWRPKFRLDTRELSSLIGFSGNLVGFNAVNFLIRNADNMLIGRFLGTIDLGYYSLAYRLMLWPLQNISSVVCRVLFPLLSSLPKDRLADVYVKATAGVLLITAPLIFGFFVLREPIVLVALGARWLPLTDILFWLLPVGLLQCVGTLVGTLYLATGRTDLMLKWSAAAFAVVIPCFLVGVQWGITGIAASYFFASLILFWPSLAIPLRLIGLRVSRLLARLIPTLASASFMALVIASFSSTWPNETSDHLFRLIVLFAIGFFTYLSMCLLIQRRFLKELWRLAVNR